MNYLPKITKVITLSKFRDNAWYKVENLELCPRKIDNISIFLGCVDEIDSISILNARELNVLKAEF
jgi:hypothetical protein